MTAISSSTPVAEAGRDSSGELAGGPGRPIALRPAMPLEQVGLEAVDRPEQLSRSLDEPEEERRAEAQVRRGDGRGAVGSRSRLHRRPIRVPARRRDDEPAAAGGERRRDVVARPRRPATPRSSGPASRGRFGRARRPAGRPSSRASVAAFPERVAIACPSGPLPRMIVSIDVPRYRRGPPFRRHQKSRGHRLVSAAPGASDPGGPCRSSSVRAVRAPGPVPPGRAARASSWPQRSGSDCAWRKCCA